MPTGQSKTWHSTIPPAVSLAIFCSLMNSRMAASVAGSGQ